MKTRLVFPPTLAPSSCKPTMYNCCRPLMRASPQTPETLPYQYRLCTAYPAYQPAYTVPTSPPQLTYYHFVPPKARPPLPSTTHLPTPSFTYYKFTTPTSLPASFVWREGEPNNIEKRQPIWAVVLWKKKI